MKKSHSKLSKNEAENILIYLLMDLKNKKLIFYRKQLLNW